MVWFVVRDSQYLLNKLIKQSNKLSLGKLTWLLEMIPRALKNFFVLTNSICPFQNKKIYCKQCDINNVFTMTGWLWPYTDDHQQIFFKILIEFGLEFTPRSMEMLNMNTFCTFRTEESSSARPSSHVVLHNGKFISEALKK